MCCKNQLPENDFEYIERPKLFNQNRKKTKANILIENLKLDIESETPLNLDILIIYNNGVYLHMKFLL